MKFKILMTFSFLLSLSCNRTEELISVTTKCLPNTQSKISDKRSFKMGFSTWSFGPSPSHREETYQYIQNNGDVYAEQVDDKIPWNAWINDTALPKDFVNDVNYRLSKKQQHLKLVLSISPLNTGRDDLIEDWNANTINYSRFDDKIIENAYFKHVKYLVEKLEPDYLIIAMESNDLLKNKPLKWDAFKLLMTNVRSKLKEVFPTLPISESVTLHNLLNPQVDEPASYIQEVSSYINQLDFVAISFYPFFKNQHSKREFQKAFDFLHTKTTKPIAIVETNHLASDLIIPNLNTNITSNVCEQKDYLEVLLENANLKNYRFVIWWAYKDYDLLWNTFPETVKDVGQIWKDTGLIDELGSKRPAHDVWESFLSKKVKFH